EVDNSPLFSFVAYDVTAGTTGSFSPDVVSVLATGAIWSRLIPHPEMPVECTLNLTTYELVSETERRVAGSVSCLSALSGIGEAGSTPLTLEAWTFSVLLERGSGD